MYGLYLTLSRVAAEFMRIRGRYVKSDALFAACHPAKWLVLRGVIHHSAPHCRLPRNLPNGNYYPSHPGTTGGGRCRPCRGRSRTTWRLDAAGALRSSRTCPGRPAQQAAQSLSQARYPGALPAADRRVPLRGRCFRFHGRLEKTAGILNIKDAMRTSFSTVIYHFFCEFFLP